jgi:predicted Zn-dependent protease with MMP-like domain/soluble cytochrome b562
MAEFVQDLQAMLDTVDELLQAGELDQAWLILDQLETQYPDAPEVPLVMGDAAMDDQDLEYALELYDRASELDPDWTSPFSARAECLLEMGRVEEARTDVERALKLDAQNAQAHWVRAVVHELDGKDRLAQDGYRRAASLAPDVYHVPTRLTRRAFDLAVRKAIDHLPADFRKRMEDEGVEIFVKDLPDPEEHPESGLGPLILGAFDGHSLTERRESDPWTQIPPRICLYQMNIERIARSRDELVKEIEVTIVHEVGHYFGLEDDDLERLDLA